MSARVAFIVGVLWLASLVVAVATAREQEPKVAPAPEPRIEVVPVPDARILSGGDIGFRVEGWQGKTPTGTLVIRLNGRWVEPTTTKKMVPVTR